MQITFVIAEILRCTDGNEARDTTQRIPRRSNFGMRLEGEKHLGAQRPRALLERGRHCTQPVPPQPSCKGMDATVLAIESLVFIGVHVKYHEIPPIIRSGVLGLLMAFIAYGRMVLKPIF